MGLLDEMKDKPGKLAGKAKGAVEDHSDQLKSGLDRAADAVDSRTGHKYSDKLNKGVAKAKGAIDKTRDQGKGDR